ncbi:hypothetical protein [Chroococcidiopsis sp. SAG 2025]|nr:hypothetical protein [Chroococcidiopsis sp. SAG 2025]
MSAVLIGGKVGQIIEYRVRLMRSPPLLRGSPVLNYKREAKPPLSGG